MSRDVRDETRGLDPTEGFRRPSSAGGQAGISTETVYRGRRDSTAPVGEECTVTVDGEPLARRYDLLSASPTGFEWNYRGSGPAQLAIAVLAHAYDAEFAKSRYQQFKRDIVSELPEDGWILTKRDLDEWRREVVDSA